MKNKQTAQPPAQQNAREVNTTYTTDHQQYCPMYLALNANQVHPSTLASAYYPNFLPAWRPAPSQQPPAGNYRSEASLTYVNPTLPPPHNLLRNKPNVSKPKQVRASAAAATYAAIASVATTQPTTTTKK